MGEMEESPRKAREWHWLIRLPVGLVLAFCALACGAFSSVLVFAPPPKNPPLARCFGVVMVLVCMWVLRQRFSGAEIVTGEGRGGMGQEDGIARLGGRW